MFNYCRPPAQIRGVGTESITDSQTICQTTHQCEVSNLPGGWRISALAPWNNRGNFYTRQGKICSFGAAEGDLALVDVGLARLSHQVSRGSIGAMMVATDGVGLCRDRVIPGDGKEC